MPDPSLTPERLTKRLTRIFTKTFPEMDPALVPHASTDNVKGWDSIATLTLFMQCEEDFGIKLGYDRIAETKTYAQLYALVEGLTG